MASTRETRSRRNPWSGREVVLLFLALLASAWLVALAEGPMSVALTFLGLLGLHASFALGRVRSFLSELIAEQKAESLGDENHADHSAHRSEAEISRKRSAFLASMSHEIRNPLNGIIGMAELLLNADLTPDQRDYARTIQGSAKGLLTILNDILDFSKIEAGNLELEEAEFSLRHCVDSVVSLLYPRAHERGIDLVALVKPTVADRLIGDGTRVRQVLTCLVSNAVKFTERGWVKVLASTYDLEESGARSWPA